MLRFSLAANKALQYQLPMPHDKRPSEGDWRSGGRSRWERLVTQRAGSVAGFSEFTEISDNESTADNNYGRVQNAARDQYGDLRGEEARGDKCQHCRSMFQGHLDENTGNTYI